MPNEQAAPSPSTVQVMITLASIAYAPEAQIGTYLQNTSYSTQGEWSLVWGPCSHLDDILYTDNLVYVAHNATSNAYAVVIRGTNLIFSGSTFIDLFEDLEIDTVVYQPISNSPSDSWIAQGTYTGLSIINDFQDYDNGNNGASLVSYLKNQSPSTLYVTGHSLGGCLTTVLAPSLFSALNSPTYPIIPYTFAAPTAGNAAYANWYDQTFPKSYRYYNTNDAIPMAWNNLDGIAALYPPVPLLPPLIPPVCPPWLQLVLEGQADFLSDLDYDYTHTNGDGSSFTGKLVASSPTFDWYAEVLLQHSHVTYLAGLGAQPVDLPEVFMVKPVVRNPKYEVEFRPKATLPPSAA